MAAYTVRNLKDVEDSAPKFGMSPDVEARFANDDLDLESSGASYLRLDSGVRMPFGHRHRDQEELYVVVDGGGRVKLDDDVVDLRRWDAVRIPPEVMRCLEGGPDGIALVLFGAPQVGRDDVEMVQGWWTD
jgi:mannose-6-phosphate isomerase-like protein (cupin superfamily)